MARAGFCHNRAVDSTLSLGAVSDEALVAAVAGGNADAVVDLLRRFQARVYGLARSMVGDASAEDVAQEAFVRVWRSAGTYRAERGVVAAWVLTITRNVALDHLRRRKVRPAVNLDVHVHDRSDQRPSPETLATLAIDGRRALAALGTLPEGQRRAVLLATYAGRTTAEISQLDQVPIGTAKTRLRQGLLALRSALGAGREVGEEVGS